jgi:hypothetical protein
MLNEPGFAFAALTKSASVANCDWAIDHHQAIELADQRDRHEVLVDVERELVVERERRRGAAGEQQQRMAVRGRAKHRAARDDTVRARHVLDDEALSQLVAELVGNDPDADVADAARPERNGDPHRLRRIGLRKGRSRRGAAERRHRQQHGAAGGVRHEHPLPFNRLGFNVLRGGSPRRASSRASPAQTSPVLRAASRGFDAAALPNRRARAIFEVPTTNERR